MRRALPALLCLALLDQPAPIAGRLATRLEVMCRHDAAGAPLVVSPFGGVCEVGERLYFAVQPPPELGYFAAVAVAANGTATWYLSETVAIPPGDELRWLGASVEIAAEQPSGESELYGVFSPRPLDLDGLRLALSRPSGQVVLIRQKILVLPPA